MGLIWQCRFQWAIGVELGLSNGLSLQLGRPGLAKIGGVVGLFSEPFVIVGQTDEREGMSVIRQTSDHKNKFKYAVKTVQSELQS